jgi:hypothetical protein
MRQETTITDEHRRKATAAAVVDSRQRFLRACGVR